MDGTYLCYESNLDFIALIRILFFSLWNVELPLDPGERIGALLALGALDSKVLFTLRQLNHKKQFSNGRLVEEVHLIFD